MWVFSYFINEASIIPTARTGPQMNASSQTRTTMRQCVNNIRVKETQKESQMMNWAAKFVKENPWIYVYSVE